MISQAQPNPRGAGAAGIRARPWDSRLHQKNLQISDAFLMFAALSAILVPTASPGHDLVTENQGALAHKMARALSTTKGKQSHA
jgi:hypothetical protein